MGQTGYKIWLTRKQLFLDPATGLPDYSNPTGATEPNSQDSKYIPPEYDIAACPIGFAPYATVAGNTQSSTTCLPPITNPTLYTTTEFPGIGDTVYANSLGLSYSGSNRWYWWPATGSKQFKISFAGIITDEYNSCF